MRSKLPPNHHMSQPLSSCGSYDSLWCSGCSKIADMQLLQGSDLQDPAAALGIACALGLAPGEPCSKPLGKHGLTQNPVEAELERLATSLGCTQTALLQDATSDGS